MYQAIRYHDISMGHRVVGHEHKCRFLHGHNYRIHFHCEAPLDDIGRVVDFSVIKSHLCEWLETCWDHRMLLWEKDPMFESIRQIDDSVLSVPFNPTAEQLAAHLVNVVGPKQLEGTGVKLTKVIVEETRKCSASYTAIST